jgi:uncharacterized phosphosugar-binding protein
LTKFNQQEQRNMSGIDLYYQGVLELQERVIAKERDLLVMIAGEMAEVIRKKGKIFIFGTGHSHMLAEEAYFRAGGLIPVVPVFFSGLMIHENVYLSSMLERTPGLAKPLLDAHHPAPGDMMFVFSNSGVNQLPVEMALYAKSCGLSVVSVCSVQYAQVAPLSSIGKRLYDVTDFNIDNGGIPGDALILLEPQNIRVGPTSTLMAALIWNCLITETAMQLQDRIGSAPVLVSGNVAGSAEHNEVMLAQWMPGA